MPWDLWELVDGGIVDPHWLSDGSSFWYAGGTADSTVLFVVTPRIPEVRPLVDVVRVRELLSGVLGTRLPGRGLPFSSIAFMDPGESVIRFVVDSRGFELDLRTYRLQPWTPPAAIDDEPQLLEPYTGPWWRAPLHSPDGRWRASNVDGNVVIESTAGTDRWAVTEGGSIERPWVVGDNGWWGVGWWEATVVWSPDSRRLALRRVDYRDVSKVRVMDWSDPQSSVTTWPYGYAGEEMARNELWIADLDSRELVPVTLESNRVNLHLVGWAGDPIRLFYATSDRHERQVQLRAADPATGDSRLVQSEVSETFVRSTEGSIGVTLLGDGEHFIRASQRDGWRHLYLYRMDGTLERRLTAGEYPVGSILRVEEDTRLVYYEASSDTSRPYDLHVHRVHLDTGIDERLTRGRGSRTNFRMAPSGEYFLVDNVGPGHTSVELWSVDGEFLRVIDETRTERLEAAGWSPPEEVVARAGDGRTALWGLLFKPIDFDPARKYPVVHWVYGPGGSAVVEEIRRGMFAQAVAGRDFVVVQLDVRGSPSRGKAFEDAFYGVAGRHETAEHVGALRQLAEDHPYMDLANVGIMGFSMGGYHAVRGLLLAPGFFKAGASFAGLSEVGWAYYMRPRDESPEDWEYASNISLIDNLSGPLLLMHGTADLWVPLSETMKLVDALTRAGKPYDLKLFPGEIHSLGYLIAPGPGRSAEAYLYRSLREHFLEHLTHER